MSINTTLVLILKITIKISDIYNDRNNDDYGIIIRINFMIIIYNKYKIFGALMENIYKLH